MPVKIMRNKNLVYFILLFSLLSVSSGSGETDMLLTLEDAIEIALEKSYEMKSLRLAVIAAENQLSGLVAFRIGEQGLAEWVHRLGVHSLLPSSPSGSVVPHSLHLSPMLPRRS